MKTLMAWRAHRQGLDGRLAGKAAPEVLEQIGWQRTVGGVTPYLALWSRAGVSREQADKGIAEMELHELPAARGCTYLVPKSHFGIALACAKGFTELAQHKTAIKHCGVTEEEVASLKESVLEELKSGPLDSRGLKAALGDKVRHLGDAGKKRGMTTTQGLAVLPLQVEGKIRRIPKDGRVDNENYLYAIWENPPEIPEKEDAYRAFGEAWFDWIGAATLDEFKWFSGQSKTFCKDVMAGLELVELEEGLWCLPHLEDEARSFSASNAETRFVGSMDNITHLRRNVSDLLEQKVEALGDKMVFDSPHHMVVHGGELVGLWDFDAEAQEVVVKDWSGKPDPSAVQEFIKDQLGDAPLHALDKAAKRGKRLDALRQ